MSLVVVTHRRLKLNPARMKRICVCIERVCVLCEKWGLTNGDGVVIRVCIYIGERKGIRWNLWTTYKVA